MTPELADLNLPETDNPFSCEGAYELAWKDVANALEADNEVGNDISIYIQMLAWLFKLGYEYL